MPTGPGALRPATHGRSSAAQRPGLDPILASLNDAIAAANEAIADAQRARSELVELGIWQAGSDSDFHAFLQEQIEQPSRRLSDSLGGFALQQRLLTRFEEELTLLRERPAPGFAGAFDRIEACTAGYRSSPLVRPSEASAPISARVTAPVAVRVHVRAQAQPSDPQPRPGATTAGSEPRSVVQSLVRLLKGRGAPGSTAAAAEPAERAGAKLAPYGVVNHTRSSGRRTDAAVQVPAQETDRPAASPAPAAPAGRDERDERDDAMDAGPSADSNPATTGSADSSPDPDARPWTPGSTSTDATTSTAGMDAAATSIQGSSRPDGQSSARTRDKKSNSRPRPRHRHGLALAVALGGLTLFLSTIGGLPATNGVGAPSIIADAWVVTEPSEPPTGDDDFRLVVQPSRVVQPALAVATSQVAQPSQEMALPDPTLAMVEPSPPLPRVVWGGSGHTKVVALTFDDGYSAANTSLIFNILVREHVPATFFANGYVFSRGPKIWQAIAAAGYPVANHGYSHVDMTKLTDEAIAAELVNTHNAFERLTGTPMLRLYRPPYGTHNAATDRAVAAAGYPTIVLWNVTDGDTAQGITDADAVALALKGNNEAIVLLHAGPDITPRILPAIIAGYRARGFGFVTVPDLLRA